MFSSGFWGSIEGRILASGLLLVGLWFLRWSFHQWITRKVVPFRRRYGLRQSVSYGIFLLGIFGLIWIWATWLASLWTFLGLIAAALTIISKELLLNIIAQSVIVWRGLFAVGDRIQVGTHVGDVIEVGLAYFTLSEVGLDMSAHEPTGRVLKVPNSLVLTQPVANYTRGHELVWDEMTVHLGVSENIVEARAIAQAILEEVAYELTEADFQHIRNAQEEIIFVKTKPTVHVRIAENHAILNLRYLCKYYRRREKADAITAQLLTRFTKAGITLG